MRAQVDSGGFLSKVHVYTDRQWEALFTLIRHGDGTAATRKRRRRDDGRISVRMHVLYPYPLHVCTLGIYGMYVGIIGVSDDVTLCVCVVRDVPLLLLLLFRLLFRLVSV